MTDHVIALAALFFGGISALVGTCAIIYAHLAVNRANDAKKLAAEANDIAARGEAREVEKHDVHWDGDWDPQQPGRYLLRKRGDDEARNVRARVSYGDDEKTVSEASMAEDGQTLVFVFPEALADYQDEYEDRESTRAAEASGMMIPARMPRMYRVQERVEWLTPLSTPKLHEDNPMTTFSLYFDR